MYGSGYGSGYGNAASYGGKGYGNTAYGYDDNNITGNGYNSYNHQLHHGVTNKNGGKNSQYRW